MPRPIRMFDPGALYFVTNRVDQGRLLLTPAPRINRLIGGVLAKGLDRFDVCLYAWVFMSNHFHAIVSGQPDEISGFVGYIEANITREIGPQVDWRAPFWQRRFSAEAIVDDDALLARVKYLGAHGIKECLISEAEEWPGLTCIPELLHGMTRLFPWIDRTAMHHARLRGKETREELFTIHLPLRLTVLPCWQHLTPEQRQRAAKQLLEDAQQEAAEQRGDKPVLGAERVCEQDPHSLPSHVKRSARPLCHASSKQSHDEFKQLYSDFVDAYREASEKLRKGAFAVVFPPNAFRPPLPFAWKATADPVSARDAAVPAPA